MQLTDADWKIMMIVWKRSPASARDVHEALHSETQWAYTTVKTMMDRLVEKGALRSRLRGNQSLYEPIISESDSKKSAIRALVDRAFAGTMGPLVHHLITEEKLSSKERDELLQMLKKAEKLKSTDTKG